jgi:hypothetical protein
MKIQEFYDHLTSDPYGRYACCAFRSIDGVIFVKQEEGTFVGDVADPDDFPILVRKLATDTVYTACEPYWVMGAVIEDDVLLTHSVFTDHVTGRNRYYNNNYRTNWVNTLLRDRVSVEVSNGQPPILKPHTRKLRNRYDMIRDILLAGLQPDLDQGWEWEDLDLLMGVREWWDLAWAYALTDTAKRVSDCNSKIASSLTAVSFDNLTNLDDKLKAIREKVSASDFEAAKKLFTPLEEQIGKLSTLIHTARGKLDSAGDGLSRAQLPDQRYRLTKGDDKKERYLFKDAWHAAATVRTKGDESLLESFGSLSDLFNKIGLPISAPYGVSVCPENIGKLAVLNETIREVILTSPYDEAEADDNKEPVPLLG